MLLCLGPTVTPAATKSNRRDQRDSSYDRLRRRSPDRRWEELRERWMPIDVQNPEAPPEAQQDVPTQDVPTSDSHSDPSPSEVADETRQAAPIPVRYPHAPPPSSPVKRGPATVDTTQEPTLAEEETPGAEPGGAVFEGPQPFDTDPQPTTVTTDVPAPFPDGSGVLPEAVEPLTSPIPSAQRVAQYVRPEQNEMLQASATGALRPVTSILPYYDYMPAGASRCEFMCPRPEDCADENQSQPCPTEEPLPLTAKTEWQFPQTQLYWEASNLYHNPLYFEDFALERYGHTHHDLIEPFVSVSKFGVQVLGMPYQMALHPVHECQYTLGWYRPGECAPKKCYQVPWNTKSVLSAGAAYTGLIFLIP